MGGVAMIVFDRLWETMAAKGITKYMLREHHGIDQRTLSRLRRNENVETNTLAKLCGILECKLEDIAAFQKT
jgi:DNA-binding Xre family transcriptional regulator